MLRKLEEVMKNRGKIGKNLKKSVEILWELYLIYVFFLERIIFYVENGPNKEKNREKYRVIWEKS